MKEINSIDVRPYQMLCLICRNGRKDSSQSYPHEKRLDEIQKLIKEDLSRPITLRCNCNNVYNFQNPGHEYDTPEGKLFNTKRDLDIFQKLGLVPGSTRPADDLFDRIFEKIDSCIGICGYQEENSSEWLGCPLAKTGNFEKGHELGLDSIISPRPVQEKNQYKDDSVKKVNETEILEIRPHHLMCMSCFHGDGENFKPIAEDNLHEVIVRIHANPDIPVQLVPGPCMICPPCSCYQPERKQCVGGRSRGLRDEKKDLDVLQLLGHKYGDIVPAQKLIKKLYDKINNTVQICGFGNAEVTAREWTVCGGEKNLDGNVKYKKARKINLGIK